MGLERNKVVKESNVSRETMKYFLMGLERNKVVKESNVSRETLEYLLMGIWRETRLLNKAMFHTKQLHKKIINKK